MKNASGVKPRGIFCECCYFNYQGAYYLTLTCEKGIQHLPVDTNVTYLNNKETYLSRPLIRYNSLLLSGKEV